MQLEVQVKSSKDKGSVKLNIIFQNMTTKIIVYLVQQTTKAHQ
jgi:hypothetical protein